MALRRGAPGPGPGPGPGPPASVQVQDQVQENQEKDHTPLALAFFPGCARVPAGRAGALGLARSVILAFPPVWEPDHPHLAIPQLAGALRASGIDVQPWDLNIEFLWAQLSPPALAAIAEEQLKRLAALSQRETLVGLDAARYATALEAVLLSETVEGTASRSLEALRHREEWSSPELFSTCWRTIRRGLQVASAPFFPVRMSLDSLEGPWDPRSLSDLLAAAANPSLNPYHGPIRRLLAGRLRRSDPLLLGISLIEPAQLLATFTLLQACREQAPALPLLIGGPLCTLLQREALPPALFDLVDGVVLGEGETPLVHIAWALAEGRPWDDAPNLVRRLADGQVVANPLGEEDLRRWPGPSFAGLPLERYLLPERVLPLEFSRGCSWRKCAFCASNYGHRRLSSVLQATAVVEQMKRLHAEHGARHFFFTDEALPPGPLRQMAKQVAAEQLPFRWFGEIRLDRGLQPPDLALLAAGGCRMLVFGLESGHPRTLDAMRKGIELDHADLLLRACVEQGIAVHLWLITGFPGESEAEAKASLDFVLDRPWLHGSSNFSATFNYFQMTRACPLAQEGGVGLCRIGQRKCRPEHDLDLDLEVPYSILPRDDGQQPIPPERTAEMAGLLQGMLDDVLGDAPR
ncbi:MAG: B12-binding domain-containing radical SAM protein, partial [Deltaproteobacteria bacterium]|nr:B12-binding domain-containing radical SAM protein [Deltaproteobacteria bacterium]